MNPEFRDRVVLPFALPIGIILFIAAVAFGMAKVLLEVPAKVAVAVALMTAVSILVAGSVVAIRPRLNRIDLGLMLAVAAVPVVAGLAVAAGLVNVAEEEGEHGETPEPSAVQMAAINVAFDKRELRVPAGSAFDLEFENKEAVPHNVSILRSQGGEKLFTGEIFPGPAKRTYHVPALPGGNLYFQCDIHPNMSGTVIAEGVSERPAEAGEGAAGVLQTITAKANKFNKSELRFASGQALKLEFDNQDAGIPHNVTILKEQGSSDPPLFIDIPFAGPNKKTYSIPPLEKGTYFFRCDVHATTMTGRIVVT